MTGLGWLMRIREDLQAARDRDPASRSSLEILLTYPGVHALIIYRAAHGLERRGVPLVPRLISHLGRLLTGIEIHPGARIGRYLFIDHGMGVVIGETAEIGDHVHLFQGVTLGGTSTRREKRHPTLEDHVVVGAGAELIGAITVGRYSRIGAGAVVVSSVPEHATVVGVPGHVVAYTNQGNDTVERLPDPEWDRIDALERRLTRLEASLGTSNGSSEARGTQGIPATEAGGEPGEADAARPAAPAEGTGP